MAIAFIYKIISPCGRYYIGSTINLKSRFNYYKYGHCKSQRMLYNSIKKYGWENHKFEIILKTTEELRFILERLFGEYYNCLDRNIGLNLKLPKYGDKICISDESRLKMSLAKRGKVLSKERLNKMLIGRSRVRTPYQIKNAQESRKKIVLNTMTGVYYESATQASLSISHIKAKTFMAMMSGQLLNRTGYVYC